ncbi:MAG: hypothetical protein R3A13_08520 [Bdellovibrionota bacterium]
MKIRIRSLLTRLADAVFKNIGKFDPQNLKAQPLERWCPRHDRNLIQMNLFTVLSPSVLAMIFSLRRRPDPCVRFPALSIYPIQDSLHRHKQNSNN